MKKLMMGVAAAAFAAGGATTTFAADFGSTITTPEQAMEATSLVEKWLNGEIPSKIKVAPVKKKIQLRYASYLPKVSGLEKQIARALVILNKEAGGAFDIKTYYSQSLHPHREAFTSVRDGIADMSACFSIFEGGSFNMMHAISLPNMFGSTTAGTQAYTELFPKYFKEEYEKMGVLIVRPFIPPPYNMIGNHKYEVLEDFKGSKTRISGRIQTAAYKLLGAAPSTIPANEAYTALQRGVIDSVALNDAIFITFKLHEISKYHSETSLVSVNLEYCMNKEWFQGLPKDIQKVVYHWGQKANHAAAQAFYERGLRSAKATFKKKGIKFFKPTEEERQKWLKIMSPVVDQWVEETEAKGLPAKQLIADFKAARAKYDAMTWNEIFQGVLDEPVHGLIDGF